MASPKQKFLPSIRELRCHLDADERRERTQTLLDGYDRRDALEDELRTAKANIKAKQEELRETLGKLRGVLRIGEEVREVACSTFPVWDEGKMVTQREDTGEIIDSRLLTDEERQGKLFAVKAAPVSEIGQDVEAKEPAAQDVEAALAGAPVQQQATGTDAAFPEEGDVPPPTVKNPTLTDKPKTSRRKRADTVRSGPPGVPPAEG